MSFFRSAKSAALRDQSNVDPHRWQLPNSYSTKRTGRKPTVIPDPSVVVEAYIPGEPKEADEQEARLLYPDVGHAAVHLALLECFHRLKHSASELKVDADLPPSYEDAPADRKTADTPKSSRVPLDRDNQAWNLLVRLAVERFSKWWSGIGSVLQHASAYSRGARPGAAVQLSKEYLPPLDVLLVWYALMLDTDAYQAICHAREVEVPGLMRVCFPWPAVRDVIDLETMHFSLPRGAQNIFSTLSGQRADILEYLGSPPAYSDESLPMYGVDLVAQVKKQEGFIAKSHSLFWIRSPALRGSLARARAEYLTSRERRNGALIAETEGLRPMAYGVELMRRTHGLYPRHYAYFAAMAESRGHEVDGKVSSHGSQSQKGHGDCDQTHAEYCSCWTCERIRDYMASFTYTASDKDAWSRAKLSPISPEQLREIQDDIGFHRAVEEARQQGRPLPTRPMGAAQKLAEREAERKNQERQDRAGYLPGAYEYVEVQADGTRKIRTQKGTSIMGGSVWLLPF